MSAEATRERIMDTADRLFGIHGFQGTSLRALTREAGVNLAAVHYHFGSKQELLRATLSRHVDAINTRRLELLDALEAAHPGGDVPVEDILHALIRPAFEFTHASPENTEVIRRMSSLLHSESVEVLRPLVEEVFGEIAARFSRALVRAVPHLDERLARLRLGFAIGCMLSQIDGRGPSMPGSDEFEDAERVEQLVTFVAAGLRATADPKEGPR